MTVINPFTKDSESERYDNYRPKYHDLPFQKLSEFLKQKPQKSLDVCCGTGHSTSALMKICTEVIGCDLSASMLATARRKVKAEFIEASAEKLPFKDREFDFLNISMAFQWLDQGKFLKEAHRVLKQNAYFSIDNYGFTGNMVGNEFFKQQYISFDKTHFPTAKRNRDYPDNEKIQDFGFKLIHEIPYQQEVKMNVHQFINYLMTRSNFLVLAQDQQEKIPQLLYDFYNPLFAESERQLTFRGQLKLYQAI